MTPIPDLITYQDPEVLTPPEPPADACPYCDRIEGHEPDCSEAADWTPSRFTPGRWNEEHP
ncbi:hypothetical protein [Brachybacterium kimchii]|uniref:Uncharacterized protein n=1 Tax=Brachybacterium kimchii TaxID=2942909 RepID=A0ABY4N4H6_9MICO|nr:hypothetical protein [Brachybacterium kimchii]UQN29462.1 hypothetical protein M4486_17785 [Brachybacterium kimchii]